MLKFDGKKMHVVNLICVCSEKKVNDLFKPLEYLPQRSIKKSGHEKAQKSRNISQSIQYKVWQNFISFLYVSGSVWITIEVGGIDTHAN